MRATNKKDDSYNYEDSYCEMLDELWPVKIGSLEYSASMVLKSVDETAYRCWLIDYADSQDDEWICDECGDTYDNELEAEECCRKECDECWKIMDEWYVINGWEEHYCSDECLHKHISEKEYVEMYDWGNSDTYWTDWK